MARDTGELIMQAQLQRKRIALIALIVVALGLMIYRMAPGHAEAAGENEPANVQQHSAATSTGADGAALVAVPVTWPIELERDPFRTTVAIEAPLGPARDEVIRAEAKRLIRPQMILQGNPARVMVDGHIVQVGETFAGFKIAEIENRSIVVEKEGVRVRIDI